MGPVWNNSRKPLTFVSPIGAPSGPTTSIGTDFPGSAWRSSVIDSALGSTTTSATMLCPVRSKPHGLRVESSILGVVARDLFISRGRPVQVRLLADGDQAPPGQGDDLIPALVVESGIDASGSDGNPE